ncbi:hypothetical protein LRS03_06410 [Rhizobacter sp. J219]|uniref:hypothetical protein n=1 Tax=Rhizobacter sp. J219 TaxID=2898430 RepID=UPI0021511285|nr:hypothetical protein [Rhizobacter sp. J219]MCR5882514.1 hypothetical protein [Rhizobacter sp. J219]
MHETLRIALISAHASPLATLGGADAHRARSMFTWEQVTQQLVEVYRTVCRLQALDLPEPAGRQLHGATSERAFAP